MTRFLLDTNVVSESFKPQPSSILARWMADQADESLLVAAISIGEIWRGVLKAPAGRKRRELEAWFSGSDGPPAVFAGRVLAFDERAALQWAELVDAGEREGRPRSATDMLVAATAAVHECVVATANERHFRGVVPMINPFREPA